MLNREQIPFQVGIKYHRRSGIHGRYGGQQYGGCCTPKSSPFIFLFTGSAGKGHGYHDETVGAVFNFYGEGQKGDMRFIRNNKAIRDHVAQGKRLLLFSAIKQKEKGWVRYEGEFTCISYELRRALDTEGLEREAIVFHLLPLTIIEQTTLNTEELDGSEAISIAILRKRAYENAIQGIDKVNVATALRHYRNRSKQVHDYVLARAAGICEGCNAPAPFLKRSGAPYLEPHHTIRLADEGPDSPNTVIALCPTCHKRVHFGRDGVEYNRKLAKKVEALEE